MRNNVLEIPAKEIPEVVVVQTTDRTAIFKPVVDTDLDEMPAAREALLRYMEGQSEMNWSAGWLTGLHTSLLGDPGYEWLVCAVGGWWEFAKPEEGGNHNWRKFVPGTLEDLKALHA